MKWEQSLAPAWKRGGRLANNGGLPAAHALPGRGRPPFLQHTHAHTCTHARALILQLLHSGGSANVLGAAGFFVAFVAALPASTSSTEGGAAGAAGGAPAAGAGGARGAPAAGAGG